MSNFKAIIFFTILSFTFKFSQATVFYVNIAQPNNLGNGLNWANAKKDIQNAINLAVPGDSVWVAAGIYVPTDYPPTSTLPITARSRSFFITDGVKLFGGFNGTEANFSQQNYSANSTTLSGDFAGNDASQGLGFALNITGNAENAYHVVLAVAPITGAVGITIDGFNIIGGNANGFNTIININGISVPSSNGGGICLYNGTNLIIHNSISINSASNASNSTGAGVFIVQGQNTIAMNSINRNYGLGVMADSSIINYNNITGNYNTGVKGIYNDISNNYFYYNGRNNSLGGGIYCQNTKITNNIIKENESTIGGGIYSLGNDTIYHNTISGNISHFNGGGLYSGGSSSAIDSNSFLGNYAYHYGGGIYSSQTSKLILSENNILNNGAQLGGGIFTVSNTNFYNNTIINNFANDTIGGHGGGIYIKSAIDTLINNVIYGNKAVNTTSDPSGGGIAIYNNGQSYLSNNSIVNNYANNGLGSGLFVASTSANINLDNNIFWGNYSQSVSGFEDFLSSGQNVFNNCLLQLPISNYTFLSTSGLHDLGLLAANNLFATDPKFVDSTSVAGADGIHRTADDGLRLKSTSPCVNTAIAGIAIPTTDIIGTNRPQGTGIDIGAYEKIYCAPVALPINTTPLANLNICNGFSTALSVSSVQPSDSIFWYADSTTFTSINNGYNYTTSTLTTTDTFWISAHNCDSSSGRIPIIVHVNPIISISSTPNDTVCVGTPIILTASGANTYSWTGGITNGMTFTPTVSATYTVTATDINGCTRSSTQPITVNLSPTIAISVTPFSAICFGSIINLIATGASLYSWSGGINNGVNFIPATSNTYTVTATDSNGCIASSTQSITVNPLPTINIIVSPNDTICSGTALALTANGATTYSWSGGITNATPFMPAASNTYIVTATASNSCTKTSSQSIVVKPVIVPILSISSSTAQGVAGDPITYTATTNVPLPYSIDWYRNMIFSNTTSNNIWNTNIFAGSNNIYAVIKSVDNCLTPDSAKSNTLVILNVTGIADVVPEGFGVYPNPASNFLTLKGLHKNDVLKMYNTLGQLLLTEANLDSNNKVLNISSYANGIYTIVFERKRTTWSVKFEKR